jgi:hypothetical protein
MADFQTLLAREVEHRTGITNIASTIEERAALVFNPQKTVEDFVKDFLDLRSYVKTR